jgi:hypothetical protein
MSPELSTQLNPPLNTLASPRQAAPREANSSSMATQSQNPGAWYNPLPNPYAYGLPSNGGNIYDPMMMGGMYGGGISPYGGGMPFGGGMPYGGGMYGGGMMPFGGGMPYGGGMYGGGISPYGGGMYGSAGVTGNVWGGFNYENNNPNSAVPGYGFNGVLGPTHFQTSLSGDGVDPHASTNRIFQEHFAESNMSLAHGALFGTGFLGGMAFIQATPLRHLRGPFGNALKCGSAVLAGGALMLLGSPSAKKFLERQYTGFDHANNGSIDGNYTTERNYDVSITKIPFF